MSINPTNLQSPSFYCRIHHRMLDRIEDKVGHVAAVFFDAMAPAFPAFIAGWVGVLTRYANR